jgi:hypothetical protein
MSNAAMARRRASTRSELDAARPRLTSLERDDIRGSQDFVSEMHGDMTDIVDQQ